MLSQVLMLIVLILVLLFALQGYFCMAKYSDLRLVSDCLALGILITAILLLAVTTAIWVHRVAVLLMLAYPNAFN